MSHTFAATATDNGIVSSLKYYVGATEITSPYTFPVGVTQVRCAATDAAGNVSTATFSVAVVYEAPPVTTIPTVTKTRVSLGAPVAPKTMKRSKSYTVYGSLKPRHTAGTKPVWVYRYKKVAGKWKTYGYVKATAYNYGQLHPLQGEDEASEQGQLAAAGARSCRRQAPEDLVDEVRLRDGEVGGGYKAIQDGPPATDEGPLSSRSGSFVLAVAASHRRCLMHGPSLHGYETLAEGWLLGAPTTPEGGAAPAGWGRFS